MYIKFCRNYDKAPKLPDDANKKSYPESSLWVNLEEERDKESQRTIRIYRGVCILLGAVCLALLLGVIFLALKSRPVPVTSGPGEVISKCPQVCSLETCKAEFGSLRDQHSGCKTCDDGWLPFQDSCFFFSVEKKSWQEARTICGTAGGDLAVISNQELQTFLSEGVSLMYWIGLQLKSGAWTWVNNTTLEQSYWSQSPGRGNCAFLRIDEHPEGSWNRADCGAMTYYICQRKL